MHIVCFVLKYKFCSIAIHLFITWHVDLQYQVCMHIHVQYIPYGSDVTP